MNVVAGEVGEAGFEDAGVEEGRRARPAVARGPGVREAAGGVSAGEVAAAVGHEGAAAGAAAGAGRAGGADSGPAVGGGAGPGGAHGPAGDGGVGPAGGRSAVGGRAGPGGSHGPAGDEIRLGAEVLRPFPHHLRGRSLGAFLFF